MYNLLKVIAKVSIIKKDQPDELKILTGTSVHGVFFNHSLL